MSLLKYLKQKIGLLDPKGSLSDTVLSRAIVQANCEVEAELVSSRYSFDHMSYNRTPDSFIATAYLSFSFVGYLSHSNVSP